MTDNQPSLEARKAMMSIMDNLPSVVKIPGTRHKVKVGFLRDCTLDKITSLLLEREEREEASTDGEANMRSMAKHPYLNLKIAVLYVLNGYWKNKILYPLVWRWWAYVWRLDESQVASILVAAQKKTSVLLNWYSMNTELTKAIRADLKTMGEAKRSLPSAKSAEGRPS